MFIKLILRVTSPATTCLKPNPKNSCKKDQREKHNYKLYCFSGKLKK